MDDLAVALNNTLRGTLAAQLLSEYGKRLFFPKGIVAQSAEAAAQGVRYNATQGIATDGQAPFMLHSLQQSYAHQHTADIVSYAPTGGLPELRSKWRAELLKKNPTTNQSISEPLITPGITSGIGVAADLLVDKNDVIIIAEPMWGNYRLIFATKHQAKLLTYPLFSADGGYNIVGLRDALTTARNAGASKIIMLFNFPNNPTGYSPTVGEVEEICALLRSYATHVPLLAIIDDAYFGLWYESDCYRQSLFAPLSQLHENILAVKIDGATKEEYAWGLRIGFISFGSQAMERHHWAALEQKGLGAIRAAFSNTNRWAQYTLWQSLNSPTHDQEKATYFENLLQRYQRLTRYLSAKSEGTALTPLPFNSGYFVCLQCTHTTPEELRQQLLQKDTGIIAIGKHFIRVTYSTIPVNQIETVFDIIFQHA